MACFPSWRTLCHHALGVALGLLLLPAQAQIRVSINPGDQIEADRVGIFNAWKGALDAGLRKAGASAAQARFSSDATADMNAGRANEFDLMVGPAPVIGSAVRYGYLMVRPDLENIPDFPLPEGLEVRPVRPEHYRAIWDANTEAFRDHWGFAEPTEADYQAWLNDPVIFTPELWQIAWDTATDQVAGQVKGFINQAENERFNRRRGWCEFISVRRPWRKRGLARALIARTLQIFKERGMTESALGVDTQNLSGALRVYEACGFRPVQRSATYRKPMT